MAIAACAGSSSYAAAGLPTIAPRQTQNMTVNDNTVFQPSIRVSVAPEESAVPLALEAGFVGGRGSGAQRVDAGQLPVVFGGQTFSGPQDLSYAFDFRYFEGLLRGGRFFGPERRFSLEILIGLAYADLRLKAVGATQSAAEDISGAGLIVGGVAGWNVTSATSVRARVVLSEFGWGSDSRLTAADRIEVELAQKIGKHLALRAGYAYWQIDSQRELHDRAVVKSPIYFVPRGPSLSLELMF